MNKADASVIARTHGWLSGTPSDFQDKVLARCDLLQFAPGTSLYTAGDEAGGLYCVVEGAIKLYLTWPSGEPGLGHVAGPGYWAGDLAALTGRSRRISLTAKTHCHVLRLPRPGLLSLAEEQEGSWRHFVALMSSSLSLTLDIIDALKRDNNTKRVAACIINLAEGATDGPKTIHVSQSELGEIANLSRSRVNDIVSDFERRGWMRRGYARIDVIDISALSSFLNSDL